MAICQDLGLDPTICHAGGVFTTVAEVLELPVLQAGAPVVRAGREALGAPVRWVHVSEQRDPAGTLATGVLVLSIGVVVSDPSVSPTRYLAALREGGAVALVVELGQHLRAVPAPWVQAARALGFPLVELRRTVRFVEITEAVHVRIVGRQYERLAFAERVATVFRGLAADAVAAEVVVAEAAELLAAPVVLEDVGHRALAVAGGPAEEVLRDWGARSRHAPTGVPGTGPQGWSSVPVGRRRARWGRLVVPVRLEDDDRVRLVLDHAADTLTVAALLRGDAGGAVRAAVDRWLEDLLAAVPAGEDALQARARALGLPADGPYEVLAVVGGGAGTRQAITAAAPTALTGVAGGCVVAVLAGAASLPPNTAGTAVTGAASAATFPDLPDAVVAACRAALAAAATGAAAAEAPWRPADLGARGLVWDLRADPALLRFVESELAPVLALGDRRRAELLADARAFAEADGVVAAFAERIGVSRAAAYARADRLSAALGRDVRQPMVRLALHLALLGRAASAARGVPAGA